MEARLLCPAAMQLSECSLGRGPRRGASHGWRGKQETRVVTHKHRGSATNRKKGADLEKSSEFDT